MTARPDRNLRAEWDQRRLPPVDQDDRACAPEAVDRPYSPQEIIELRRRHYEQEGMVHRLGPENTLRVL